MEGDIGPLMFIRAVYGHGGRPGYDKEWRADGVLAGGGELLDQGVHILDLCRWFMGDFAETIALTGTFTWDLGFFPTSRDAGILPASVERGAGILPASDPSPQRRLEDNAFALLRTADGRIAQFHTSWTQWKNLFSFEVFGQAGSLCIHGLGGSYGTETLTITHRSSEGGAPKQETEQFAGPDDSWRLEWREFVTAVNVQRQPLANGEDGLKAMELVDALYQSAWTGQVVKLPINVH
jgi:predicted dehydrogenase